jgi:dTDP-4-dehydrorhamnose 3,5-epimerase
MTRPGAPVQWLTGMVCRRHISQVELGAGRGCRTLGTPSWEHGPVRIEQTNLADVVVLVPQLFRDTRGLFTRTFDAEIFDDYVGMPGMSATFVQDSQSRSVLGVIRGMHGRLGRGEAKLVRCARGAVHDVLVDIRRDSPTFGKQQAFLLDDNDFRHLYVPPGFLHGFQALTPTADVCYRINRPHDPSEDIAVAYDDPDLAIGWPQPVTVVSARDASAGSWQELLTQSR